MAGAGGPPVTDRSSRPVWLGQDARGWDHVRVHTQLLRDPRLGGVGSSPSRATVLAVYMGVAAHAELESGDARPAAETLGGYAGCDERTARLCLGLLEQVGYCEIHRRPGKASVVRLLPPPVLPVEEPESDPGCETRPSPGVPSDLPGSGIRTSPGVTPDEQEPLNESHERASLVGSAGLGPASSRDGEPGTRISGDPRDDHAAKTAARSEPADQPGDGDHAAGIAARSLARAVLRGEQPAPAVDLDAEDRAAMVAAGIAFEVAG